MGNFDLVLEKISKAMDSQDEGQIEDAFLSMEMMHPRDIFSFCEAFLDSNISIQRKLDFLFRANEADSSKSPTLYMEALPYAMKMLTQEHQDDILQIITEDEKAQESMVDYFRNNSTSLMGIWGELAKLPIVQREILLDESFIAKNMSRTLEFFEQLPQEYGYLIALYESNTRRWKRGSK